MRRNLSINCRLFIQFAVILFYFSFFTTNSFAAQALVPRTGQITPYAAGDDGTLHPGVAWNAVGRFTANGNGTVTDTLTGLVWLQDANCTDSVGAVNKSNSLLKWADALTWSNNLASGLCRLNDGSTVGDWRLPNIEELESLVDLQQFTPALPTGHPFGNVQTGGYWSSSTYAGIPTDAWTVLMDDGFINNDSKVANNNAFYEYSYGYVWPVRGGQANIVTSVAGGNGAITCDSPVIFGASANCTILPNAGFHLATFTDNGVDKHASVVDNNYSITKVTAYHSVSGSFAQGYAVTYIGNGNNSGTVPTDAAAYPFGATVTVSGNTGSLTRTGYTFAGWNTAADGSGTSYAASATFTIAGNTTLYAKWTINNYTVSFTSNGGSAVTSQSVTYNTTATAPTVPTRAGYTFAGWYTDAGLSAAFAFTTVITGDTTLFAKWTINNYTVSFTSNGGSAVTSQSVTYNTAANAPTAPTRSGHTFAGWYSDAGLSAAFAFTTVIAGDTTLYAKWISPTVADALKALQAYSGIVSLTPEEKIRYDVAPLSANGVPQGNGAVDFADIIILLRKSVGIGNW
jgi:uncharacterized repeat protein (TIGR02543 family)